MRLGFNARLSRRPAFRLPALSALLIGFVTAAAGQEVSYTRQIQPLLAKHCYACHGPDDAESGLRLSERDSAMGVSDSGERAIVPGDPDASHLIARVATEDEFDRMPPDGEPLSAESIELLRRWVAEGAAWEEHWAFRRPVVVEPPEVPEGPWAGHPIDRFVIDGLRSAGVEPNGLADRRTLIRRATYDLTGLPPDPARVEAFVRDEDPLAFERLIDELLESPHYGERWGRHWLDLVRYAETNSFERDGGKPNAWKFRDYVIRSFNEGKPYDQFVREQLAGDQLDEVTAETLTATGFYRLGIWDDEPADPLQARYDELDDIITTAGQTFLGLTIHCARCHDHKIDPIPQADYYRMLAFLADVTPYGTRGNQTGNNQVDVSPEELRQRYRDNESRRRELRDAMREIEQSGIAKMSAPDQRATEGPRKEREKVLREKLRQHLDDDQWREYQNLRQAFAEAEADQKSLPPRESVLGLGRLVESPEPTYVLFRGNPHAPADEVGPGFPELFDEADPRPGEGGGILWPPSRAAGDGGDPREIGRRRALAEWIVDDDNLLAARVMANRIWQFHFGRGIVRSSNNFGHLGTPPTHPELLDWLARRFVDGGWKLKPMHRLIMTSRVYRLASEHRPEAAAVDPENDSFWRFDPRRLGAEEVRDSLLAVNGSLNPDVYGPSIYPALSQEVLSGQSRPGAGWGRSDERERNRRSVYIHVKRSLLTPLLAAFDFPEPDRSCEARFATLQPGQALSLLNSEFVHRQAARLADAAAEDLGGGPTSPEEFDRIDGDAFVGRVIARVLARAATAEELADGRALMAELRDTHGLSARRAAELLCLSVLNWNEFVFLD